jgi:hypothetical protein
VAEAKAGITDMGSACGSQSLRLGLAMMRLPSLPGRLIMTDVRSLQEAVRLIRQNERGDCIFDPETAAILLLVNRMDRIFDVLENIEGKLQCTTQDYVKRPRG